MASPRAGSKDPEAPQFRTKFRRQCNVVTMDKQMTSRMTPGARMWPPGQYEEYERIVREEAAKRGVPAADFADVAWRGFRGDAKPMIGNSASERTLHQLIGMPRGDPHARHRQG
jgi:hypothetical protein